LVVFSVASNSLMDCELSKNIGKGVLEVSNVFREIIGLINNKKNVK
jgi:hypothetical protein